MTPVIEIKNLVVKYGEKTVLHGITSNFFPSEIRIVLGISGCGKTTLLKSIVGLIRPTAGSVHIFGQELLDPDTAQAHALLKRVGVLFQNGALLGSMTVAENIALPLAMHTTLPPEIIDEMVQIKLNQVDLPAAGALYPQELSGGMRKRAALARALALDPPLLFCDEPSAGLDPVTSAGLDELLLKLREMLGITIIVVTHELFSIEKIADNVIFLQNGKVLFDGPLAAAKAIGQGPVADFFARKESHHR
ncbi:MAG: ATP-binding cassette domain-containing protein [Chitinivibrionales bacterium]|nr:ATP-binding cassette domain-containing protein [Chitinivibrionales bacterium]